VTLAGLADGELVRRARKGDAEAYNCLIARWEARVYSYLLRLIGDPDEAMDACQEVFLKGFENLAQLKEPAHFASWLFRIAHNQAYSMLRRRRETAEIEDRAPARSPHELAGVEAALAVEAALGKLSEEQREAVLLKLYHGFKFEEIAAILRCPPSTVKSRVYAGLELLKQALAPIKSRGEP